MANGMIKFLINGNTANEVTTHNAPDVQVGEIQVWNLVNLPARNDPMGAASIVKIAIDFLPAEGLTGADIEANGGMAVIENADLSIGKRGRSGGWQFHRHILEHTDTGMMSFVEVFQ